VVVWKEMKKAWTVAWLILVFWTGAAPNSPPHEYTQTNLRVVHNIGRALYASLDARYQKQLSPDILRLESMEAPVITPMPSADRSKELNQVFVSVGYVELLNYIAHAKAIDKIQPGYFTQYVLTLAGDKGSHAPPMPPNLIDRYWTMDVMNDQASYFNQMLGLTVAISLSQEYLGYFDKYSGQMMGGKLVPINNFLTPEEWEASVKKATLNSLDCALGTEGAKALFEAIDKMPKRPAWTAFVVPQSVDLKKVNEDLATYEASYWRGGLK
jgi:hypothetical protein